MIHGRNFRLNLQGKWDKYGFYTPRFADAPDPLLANAPACEPEHNFRPALTRAGLMMPEM